MSVSDELSDLANESANSKLRILRNELRSRVTIIRGCAGLMKRNINATPIHGLPENFQNWLDKMLEAGEDMDIIIEILTSD
jgi:hypothetical protein